MNLYQNQANYNPADDPHHWSNLPEPGPECQAWEHVQELHGKFKKIMAQLECYAQEYGVDMPCVADVLIEGDEIFAMIEIEAHIRAQEESRRIYGYR